MTYFNKDLAQLGKTELFYPEPVTDPTTMETIEVALRRIDGIGGVGFQRNGIEINYVPQLVSSDLVRSELEKLGLQGKSPKKKRKGWLARAIDNLAESNQATFGDCPLECCALGKSAGKTAHPRAT